MALVAEDSGPEPPLQRHDQGLEVSVFHLVQIEQHPYCRPLQRQSKVVDRLPITPAVVQLSQAELDQV